MIRGTLAANADVLAFRLAGPDGHRQQRLHRRVALVELVRHQAGIPIQPQGELGEVVRADGVAVEALQEFTGEQDVGGDLAHHHHPQAPFAPLQAILRQDGEGGIGVIQGAHEGQHHLDVGQAHVLTHPPHRPALELEGAPEHWVGVAPGTTEAQHGVFLLRLVVPTADQVGVFVRLEVRHAHDHRLRPEGGGDGGDAFGQLLDVEADRIGITLDARIDG